MAEEQKKTALKPELAEALKQAKGPVRVVFQLRHPNPPSELLSADDAERVAYEVLDRAQKQSGQKIEDVNIFKNLGNFVVSAPAPVLEAIAEQPEIAGAQSNEPSGSMLIPPKNVRPVGRKSHRGKK